MRATHMDAEHRYSVLRKIALRTAERNFAALGQTNLRATTITLEALKASKLWDKSLSRRVTWNWSAGYTAFAFRYPKRFEIALWQDKQLICLSMGRPTYVGTALRLDVVESSPMDMGERPKVMPHILVAYGIYARLINASQIRIMNPINEKVKSYYESFGYTYAPKGDYLFRNIR